MSLVLIVFLTYLVGMVIVVGYNVPALKSFLYELVPGFLLSLFATWLASLLTQKKGPLTNTWTMLTPPPTASTVRAARLDTDRSAARTIDCEGWAKSQMPAFGWPSIWEGDYP